MRAVARFKPIVAVLALIVLSSSARSADEQFETEVKQAYAMLRDILPACSLQMNDGDVAGANAALVAAFPPATRTPAQSFLLGNLLFEADRKQSYALHKAAAAARPDDSTVGFEWAMEQHRAGEYAGALAAYESVSKAQPAMAESYALAADCLLRLGRVDDAIDAWAKSESAPQGSFEQMESLVCAVHREAVPYQRRSELLEKVTTKGDAQAAADLITLDCNFPRDWWNVGPNKRYLDHDLPAATTALKLPPDDLLGRSIACAAACAAAADNDAPAPAASVKDLLVKYRLLTDAAHTIPPHGGLLEIILNAAMQADAIDEATLREQIGPKVLAQAKKGGDLGMWNAAALTGPRGKPDEEIQLERDGWKATGDPRFAAGVLFLKQKNGQLTVLDDADLVAALKQFPQSGLIHRAAFEVALGQNKVTRQMLADAARAEFTHFTSFVAPATVVNRPRSDYLRGYFVQLKKMGNAPPAQPAP